MRNLRVVVRLALAFCVLLAMSLAAMAVAFHGLRAIEEHASGLERENIALLNAAAAMRAARLNEAVAIRDFVGQTDVDRRRAALKALHGIEQVNSAISHMDSATQSNAGGHGADDGTGAPLLAGGGWELAPRPLA
jgi:hypothetical protein